jgi:hypothetical protein
MLLDLAIGVPTMVSCLLLQALVLIYLIRYYNTRGRGRAAFSLWSRLEVITVIMLLLVVGIVAQVALWAALFVMLGEFESMATALYYSAVNFATLGYGDIVMSEAHRLLGPLEAVNGALMIGVATAALTAVFQHQLRGPDSGPRH